MRRNRVMRTSRVTVDQRKFELVLDVIALVAGLTFYVLTVAGVFSWADTGLSIGIFTGWLLRHLLH